MKRILFVDDEQHVLDGLRDSLRKQRRRWDMVFALGGAAGLEQMARGAPFDVVVSDMRMPGMDGAEFLQRVKDRYPGAARIVLSGHADQELTMRALAVSQQYLSKPCNVAQLVDIIGRACELRTLLPDPALQELVGNLDKLPSVPASYWDLMRVLARPNAGLEEICWIIERDPALHAKVLQVVNSAFFGLPQHVTSMQSAVTHLGLELIKAMAVANHVFSAAVSKGTLPGFSIEALRDNALHVAELAKRLVPDPKRASDAFTAGLLHEVGKMILAMGARERFAEVLARGAEEQRPIHLVEKELLGASHAEIGAFLLGTWGLPASVVTAIAHHHDPAPIGLSDGGLTVAVHVADALVEEASGSQSPSDHLDMALLERLGLVGELERWRELARQTLSGPG